MNGLPPPDEMQMDVSSSVLAFAESQDVSLEQLLNMVEASARVTHEKGNRRFHNWVFLVEKNVVIRMTPLVGDAISDRLTRHIPKPGPDEFLVFDECEECEGHGCDSCDGYGDVPVIRKNPKNRNGVRYER